jgi:hypothetical protein
MNEIMSMLVLIILAVVTQYMVSWAGSVLDSIGSEEISYAVFTFSDDRYMPMTTNVLMNVCIPNVILVFIFMFAKTYELAYIEKFLLSYVVFFFVWRMILICVFLRRKELYSWPYEIGMAFAGIILAYFLITYFFTTEEAVFLEASELREELWLAIIFILYKFFKQILDKKLIQNKVLKEGQITKYIIRKFNSFYKKYNHILDITKKNRNKHIFLYAVMIFEDYNRGPLIRKIEKIKFTLKKKATLGIMQFPTENMLSDEESIVRFYEWLENILGEEDLIDSDEMQIYQLAWEYNNDDRYAKSVAYIYNKLYEYIDDVPRFRKEFYMREDSSEEIFCNQVRKLKIMYDEGLLSDVEYANLKAKLLFDKSE